MGVFKKIWPDVWSARMEYILNNCVLALLEDPTSTLLGINRMLADPDYRKKIVDKVTDPVVKAFLDAGVCQIYPKIRGGGDSCYSKQNRAVYFRFFGKKYCRAG